MTRHHRRKITYFFYDIALDVIFTTDTLYLYVLPSTQLKVSKPSSDSNGTFLSINLHTSKGDNTLLTGELPNMLSHNGQDITVATVDIYTSDAEKPQDLLDHFKYYKVKQKHTIITVPDKDDVKITSTEHYRYKNDQVTCRVRIREFELGVKKYLVVIDKLLESKRQSKLQQLFTITLE